MGIGLSGMVSGLDTDAIVKALMGAQRQKSTKIENKITTNEWKLEKWKDLNTKIYSLYTGTLYKMKTQGNYLTKTTSSSNEKLVTATASSIAALGTHTVKVVSTASAQYVTGGNIEKEGLTSNSKLSEAGVAVGTIVNIACGDKSERLEVKEDTTISDFITACKDAGLNASFDTARNRFYFSSKESGKENAFSITTETFDSTGLTTRQNLDELLNYSELSDTDQEKLDEALEVIRSVDSNELEEIITKAEDKETIKELSADQLNVLSAYNTIQTIAKDAVPAKLAQDDVYGEIRNMIKEGKGTKSVYGISYSENDYKQRETEASATVTVQWKQKKLDEIYQSQDAFGNMVSDFAQFDTEITYEYIQNLESKVSKIQNGAELTLTQEEAAVWTVYTDTTGNGAKKARFDAQVEELKKEDKPEDYTALYNEEFDRLVEIDVKYYYKNSTQAQTAFEEKKQNYKTQSDKKLDANDADSATYKAVMEEKMTALVDGLKTYANTTTTDSGNGLAALGLSDIFVDKSGKIGPTKDALIDASDTDAIKAAFAAAAKGMSFVAAADGQVEVDGAIYAADSNTITVNGLTLNLKAADKNETVNITITQDTDAVYNMVKDFVKEYNELLDEMNKAYNADSARDYEPLTDEQKDAMSEKEIEKWENKIKDSLLRRDNTLNSLMSSMRTCLSGSVEVEGTRYSLASFGICTTDYSEKGKLHIYGNADDPKGAMYDDKLRAAIEENPDAVMEVLQTLSENLYNTVSDKMKSTSLSSALTVYNDKQINKEITTYKKELSELEKRLADMEARYYKQFTAMEKALSNLNSTANSFASMMGMPTQ